MTELKPCPFCGSDNVYFSLDCSCIFCDDCGALGPVCVDRNPEIYWNKRSLAGITHEDIQQYNLQTTGIDAQSGGGCSLHD